MFPNSRVGDISRYSEAGPRPAGTAMTVQFELDGQAFVALNGGPQYKFSEAISFSVSCEGQDEVDKYWNAPSAGGEDGSKDKYGMSWQIVPTALSRLLGDPDPEKARRR